jgi:hypothetical protein
MAMSYIKSSDTTITIQMFLSKSCLNRTSLATAFVLGIDRCSVYTG